MNLGNYKRNKLRAIYVNTEPTLTDQAAARDTDINVIVKQYTVHGQIPGTVKTPVWEDFTQLPTDLRGYIELAESVQRHKQRLPKELKDLTDDELLALTPQQITDKLKPPATTPTEPEAEPK